MTDAPAIGHRIWQIHVRPKRPALDPLGRQRLADVRQISSLGHVEDVAASVLYFVRGPLDRAAAETVGRNLLADPVSETFSLSEGMTQRDPDEVAIEVHYLPGVMDPVAISTAEAVADLLERRRDALDTAGQRAQALLDGFQTLFQILHLRFQRLVALAQLAVLFLLCVHLLVQVPDLRQAAVTDHALELRADGRRGLGRQLGAEGKHQGHEDGHGPPTRSGGEADRPGQDEDPARGKEHPELPGRNLDAGELQARIEHEYGRRDAERNQVCHRVEFCAEAGGCLEKPRRKAVHGVQQTTPDDHPGRKLQLTHLGRNNRTEAQQQAKRGKAVRYGVANNAQ